MIFCPHFNVRVATDSKRKEKNLVDKSRSTRLNYTAASLHHTHLSQLNRPLLPLKYLHSLLLRRQIQGNVLRHLSSLKDSFTPRFRMTVAFVL